MLKRRYALLFLILAFVITMGTVLSGAYISEGYSVSVGDVSPKLIKSPRKIENKVATERNREAAEVAAAALEPLLKRDSKVNDAVLGRLNDFLETLYEHRKSYMDFFVPDNETDSSKESKVETPNLTIALTEDQIKNLMTMDTINFNAFAKELNVVTAGCLEQGIQEIDAKTLLYLRGEIQKYRTEFLGDPSLEELAYKIISSFLEPNYIVDDEATQRARVERASKYETVYYLKDQTIVTEGDIITKEAYSALESLGLVNKSLAQNIIPILGSMLVIIIAFIVCSLYIYYFNPTIIKNDKEILLLFSLYVFCIVVVRFLVGFSYQVMPILVFTMLIAILLDAKLSIVLNLCMTIVVMYICKGGMDFFIYYTLSGIYVAILSKYSTERNRILIVGIIISLANFVLSIGVSILLDKEYSSVTLYNASLSALSGIFVVVIVIGSLPFWEATFGIVTVIKLLDLINPNNVILRRMTIEATGTYNHSLIVANLAETAAADIGANPVLARVGSYFHDIGKLRYPQYFAENQVGHNPHDEMEPYSSAQVIQSHVNYGLELADSYKLPKAIRDIIEQHHGNTLVAYFLYKYKERHPDQVASEEDFRYPHTIPQTKEAAIIMLADTVEAAVRSIDPVNKTQEEIETFVSVLIKGKLDDGQLTESSLTLKDIKMISHSFMRVFRGMYHHRVAYPTAKKPEGQS